LSPVGPFGALCVPASSRGAPGSRKVNSPIIPGLILEAFPASFRIPKRPYPSFRVRQFLCMPYVHQENQYFKNKCFFAGHKCVWYCKYGVQLNVAEFVPKLDAARARLLFAPIGISFSFHFGPSDPPDRHRNTSAIFGRFREGRWSTQMHWFRHRYRSPPCGSGPGNPHYIKIYGCAFFVVVHDLGPRHGGDPECKQIQAEPPRTST
jgi:hypothetical protein